MLSPRRYSHSPLNKENSNTPTKPSAATSSQQSVSLRQPNLGSRRKRKLSETSPDDAVIPATKKLEVQLGLGVASPMRGEVLSSLENKQSSSRCQKKLEFGEQLDSPVAHRTRFGSPVKRCASPCFQSPTVDLPNYVQDPQPRTPVGRRPDLQRDSQSRTPDWLTQIGLGMKSPDCKDGSPHTPHSHATSRVSRVNSEVGVAREGSPSVSRSPATPLSSKRRKSLREPLRSSPRLTKVGLESRHFITQSFKYSRLSSRTYCEQRIHELELSTPSSTSVSHHSTNHNKLCEFHSFFNKSCKK